MNFRRPIFLCTTVTLTLAAFFVGQTIHALNPFSEIGDDVHLDTGGDKDGGLSWGDFNNDGCLDLLVNTDDDNLRTRLYQSNCNLPDPSFTDVTDSHAAGLLNDFITERSAIWGDVNNDGYLDLAVNSAYTRDGAKKAVKIFLNSGSPAFTFGNASQEPDQIITDIPGGTNTEGLGWGDIDNDDDLDLFVENHNFGIDIFLNDGSGHFTYLDNNQTGLSDSAATGDYLAVTDFDADGDVDILARKENEADLWTHNGKSSPPFFDDSRNIDQADNGNKGGVAFCDFDSDGDFDFFWTDEGTNQIWEQTGSRSGDFDARGFSVDTDGNIDGVACGDVDNDGDVDLFLTGNNGEQLFINEGDFNFIQMNFGIDGDEDGEGAAFGDYDRDGDLDLIINQDDENELWRNNSNNDAYLMVRALLDVGDAERDAIGATAVLRDCSGNLVSGIREVNGGRGHGAQDPAIMHFGLANLGGPNATYVVEVSFVGGKMVHAAIVPSHIGGYQQIAIRNNDALNLDACQADLAVHKSSSPNPASPGQPITYTLVVSNLGPNRVTSLTLTDNLPAAIVPPYIYTAASGNYDAITGIWTHLDLAAGNTLTLTIVGTVDPTFTGTIVNTADVSPIGAIDPILDNNHDDTSNQSYIPQIMQPTPTVVPTASPSPQPTLTVSPVPTASPEPTATVSPVPSVSPEPTGTGSPTPTATVYDNDNDGEDNDDNNDYDGTTTASITGGAHPTATVPPLPVMRLPETGSLAEAQTDEDMGIRLSIRLMVTVIVAMWIIFRIWGLSSQINKPK